MSDRSPRRFRPIVDRLSARQLPSTLPTSGLVDLKTTATTTDLRDALLRTTPHNGRQGWSLNLLKADPSTRIVYGSATLLYHVVPFWPYYTQTAPRVHEKVDIAFATPLDNPSPGDIKVAISRDVNGFGPNVRRTMALGVLNFLKNDHDTLAAGLG